MNWDIALFQYINSFAGHYKILDLLAIFFAEYSQYVLGAILLLLLFWPKNKTDQNRPMILVGLVAALVARLGLKTIIYHIYPRARPFVSLPSVHSLLTTAPSENLQSFPSGHVIFFFALSYVLYKSNKKLGGWFFAASSLMGLARIFVGVHWPSDIIGGAILGIAVGVVIDMLYHKFKLPWHHVT